MRLPLTGGCQCGTVRYQITAAPLAVYVCHCTECQRQSGSAFALSLAVPRDALAVVGAGAIRSAFESIFANGAVNAHPEKVRRLQTLSCAVHSVLEQIRIMTPEGPHVAWVVATNVYLKTAQGWRLVSHHASPGSPREVQEIVEASSTLH